jgi:hypothetical protein
MVSGYWEWVRSVQAVSWLNAVAPAGLGQGVYSAQQKAQKHHLINILKILIGGSRLHFLVRAVNSNSPSTRKVGRLPILPQLGIFPLCLRSAGDHFPLHASRASLKLACMVLQLV